jgi:hypothetical protein
MKQMKQDTYWEVDTNNILKLKVALHLLKKKYGSDINFIDLCYKSFKKGLKLKKDIKNKVYIIKSDKIHTNLDNYTIGSTSWFWAPNLEEIKKRAKNSHISIYSKGEFIVTDEDVENYQMDKNIKKYNL